MAKIGYFFATFKNQPAIKQKKNLNIKWLHYSPKIPLFMAPAYFLLT